MAGRTIHWGSALVASALLSSCASQALRTEQAGTQYSIASAARGDATGLFDDGPGSPAPRPTSFVNPGGARRADFALGLPPARPSLSLAPVAKTMGELPVSEGEGREGPRLHRWEPTRMSVDFVLGLGCDELDEDVHSFDGHEEKGIAETLLRLSCFYGLSASSDLVGTVAAAQILDEDLQSTIEDSEVIWLAVGIRFRF